MSFFEELKRRNVVRTAVLYLVAAWLSLQVTDVLTSLLRLPDWAGSFVFMLLVLGLPPDIDCVLGLRDDTGGSQA